eukprot:CAMPEP_0177300490 /NCGR_PEP_ID=MMETSP0368-20130122/4575_1 /TAXON_ID=447022 ORGANISM="Scrippsiella hangoei-like, Strain SHHI-4" /NCGR_SAMPLE_ID=MMETSP0368 /ASSEMBLY_ACC=CAM_ASM_000363 /LENGTH=68 /DNA_ID=CAMNT_0018758869 /DNA_START=72 /DNA_END=274 /DNA_ORIENTATION=-
MAVIARVVVYIPTARAVTKATPSCVESASDCQRRRHLIDGGGPHAGTFGDLTDALAEWCPWPGRTATA